VTDCREGKWCCTRHSLLEGGRRNEAALKARAGARGRRVLAAGGAARAPDELETREAEAGMRNGRGEAFERSVEIMTPLPVPVRCLFTGTYR
jgi:hypothetical protein